MTVRKPPSNITIPSIDELSIDVISWHTLKCELVTPMYGGGVESTKVDKVMPIRPSAICGQLRFWWRLLAKHKKHEWELDDDKAIRTAEFELWGGMSNDGDDSKAGKVLLRVVNMPTITDNQLINYDVNELKGLRYILFPAYNAKDKINNPHKLLKQNLQWDLQFAFSPKTLQIQKEQVIETLRWWANFGGLGFRSRKGLGAVYVSQCQDFPQICQALTPDDVAQAGCQLVVRKDKFTDGLRALQTAVQKLSDFRQGVGIGRNKKQQTKHPGRSFWPEPDAIRSITGDYLDLTEENKDKRPTNIVKNHKPIHKAGIVFPRAVFGLPIIYKFINDEYYDKKDPKDGDEEKQRITSPDKHEPLPTTISPAFGERLASPLILRPIYADERNGQKQWQAQGLWCYLINTF